MYRFVPPAGGCAGLETTTDGGASWEVVNTCLPDTGKLHFEADGTGWLGATAFFTREDGDSLHRTNDGGRTWTETRVGLPDGHDPSMAIYGVPVLFDGRGLLAVSMLDGLTHSVAIYATPDDGTTWDLLTVLDTPQGLSQEQKLAASVAFASENTWWIAATGSTGADTMMTTDGGITWQTNSGGPPGTLFDLQAVDDKTAWITTTEGLFASFDGGQNWNRL